MQIWGDFDDSWVINNTVYGAAASGFIVGGNNDRGRPDRTVTANNIFAGQSGTSDSQQGYAAREYQPGSGNSTRHNLGWANARSTAFYLALSGPTDNRTADPRFADAGRRDLHLRSGSAAVDTAERFGLLLDADRHARGSAPDKGASSSADRIRRVPHALVPRRAWPDDRYPHWAVAALRAAGAEVSEDGDRGDVAVLPAAASRVPRTRAGRVIGLVDKPFRAGEARLAGAETVAVSDALAAGWEGARVVRPAVPAGEVVAHEGATLRLASVGPLHWSAGHEHAVAATALLLAGGTAVELRVVGGDGPARDAILFAAFDLGIERAVAVSTATSAPRRCAPTSWSSARSRTAPGPGCCTRSPAACPVAATAADYARELGVPALVPPRDPAALAGAILRREPGPPSATDLEACGGSCSG